MVGRVVGRGLNWKLIERGGCWWILRDFEGKADFLDLVVVIADGINDELFHLVLESDYAS